MTGVPHVQACTYMELRGTGIHRRAWQCRHTDPHPAGPDTPHDLPPDAEFGRDLDAQRADWLAATLRDQVAKTRHATRTLDEVTAVAVHLAQYAAAGVPLPASTRRWLAANVPSAAQILEARP